MGQALNLNRAAAPVWSTTNIGMVFMALAMLLLPVGDTFAKILTGVMGPIEVTMWRLIAQRLCLVPIVVLLRHRLRGAMFSPVVALSGLLVKITLTSLVTAFSVMPIATAIAIFFAEPLILTLLAGPLLGEVAGLRRYAAVGVGLVGALIVIRPGFSEFGLATLLPLVAATAYALNMIVLRRACATRSGEWRANSRTLSAPAEVFRSLQAKSRHERQRRNPGEVDVDRFTVVAGCHRPYTHGCLDSVRARNPITDE